MSPPRLADRFLTWFCAPHLREEVLGDLHERYVLRVQQLGEVRARRRYWRDVLAYLRPEFIKRQPDLFPSPTTTTMLFNYLKVAYRNLINNKVFSAINVTGLALGIACSIMLFLFILDELNYDTFTKNANHTYRLYVHSLINGNESNSPKTAAQAGNVLVRHFPEVLTSTRIGYFGDHDLRYGDKVFRETKIYTADSTYFDVFSLPFLYGDPASALKSPNSIVLTETMARKYFDDQNPVGQSFIVDGKQSYKITGVMNDFPDKSHFRCDFLLSMSTYPEVNQQNWLEANYSTYVVLKEGAAPDHIEQKMKPLIFEYIGPQVQKALGVPIESFLAKGNAYEYRLQPLSSIYLHSKRQYAIDPNTEWSGVRIGDSAYLYIFLAVAFLMLLIAVINFINLSTARSESRAKEVGIRKTIGSNRAKLIGQFITESVLLTSLAVLVALLIVTFLLPSFNEMAGRHLQLALFSNVYSLPALFIFILVVGMLAGSYPAFFLSSFQPIDVLKSGVKKRKSSLRSFLVVIQFSIAIVLILGMIIIRSQLQYIQQKNLGFTKEHILSINNAAVLGDKLGTFKAELLQNSAILAASNTSQLFTTGIPGSAYLFGNHSGTDPISFQFLDVDQDFVETFGVQLTSGRFFEKGRIADSTAVVINEAALKECKTKNVLNLELTKVDVEDIPKTYKIVGVVKDFNYESLHRGVRPLLFHLRPVQQASKILHIRIGPNATQPAIDYIEKTWRKFEKAEQCQYTFLDESLDRLYDEEQKTSLIATVFSLLSIFIACMGLFGLAIFVTEQRTKEIGIRKVLGASISEILFLLSKQFISWVMIAMLIASPIAWYAMNQWLQNFAYRTDMSWWMFAGAGTLAIGVALCTVSFHSIKAALKNPVKSLRSE